MQQLKDIIYTAIRKGDWSIDSKGVIKIVYKYKGEIIVVKGVIEDFIFKIGDAWVWNGKGTP